ncbi:hypothetical protein R6Q59_016434 [Mikania micrantha]
MLGGTLADMGVIKTGKDFLKKENTQSDKERTNPERREYVTVLLCGTSGCGKSTLSALLRTQEGEEAAETESLMVAEGEETESG